MGGFVARIKRQARGTPASRLIKTSPLWVVLRPRRFHLYCVGAPKTGTMSMAQLFRKYYRAAHEPGMAALAGVVEATYAGAIGRQELRRFLRAHDRERRLEMESSHPIALFCGELVQVFPEAKFILTVRDCHSWLDSAINQHLGDLRHPDPHQPAYWKRLNDLYFGRAGGHPPAERVLEQAGLYTLDGYLSFWAAHYRRVLDAVPEDRLLVVRTDRLSRELDRIARFAGIPADTLDATRRHSHRTAAKYDLVAQIDRAYLDEKVDRHCAELMRRFFPEMEGAS